MRKHKRFALIAVTSIVLIVSVLALGPVTAVGATTTTTTSVPPPPNYVTYDMYATDGYWTMADGTQIYSYGFIGGKEGSTITYLDTKTGSNAPLTWNVVAPTPGPITAAESQIASNAQFPAPMITCAVGDIVVIKFKNLGVGIIPQGATGPTPNDPHSIHLHGTDVDAANDGVPETSIGAIPGNDNTLTGYGNVVVYMFSPKIAGTFFYHCHQEADIHVTMGMYGAFIVYNRGEPGAVSGPGKQGHLFGAPYDKDYVLLMSDTDIRQHASEAGTGPLFNPVDYKPQYWFLNDLSFPNTAHASTGTFNWANWIAAHPGYDPMITGQVSKGTRVLLRMINMGFETQPMHMHGFHAKVLGKDQRAWSWSMSSKPGQGLEVNTITIGSGEEYDLWIDFSTQAVTSTYNPGTYSRYDNVTANNPMPKLNTDTAFPPIKEGGDPAATNSYAGGPVVSGALGMPGTSQIFVFHNHDDYKATNNGVYPGGQFTVIVPLP